ncbi:nuclease-related domain-containing protein [Pedococcus bigeumensis]|uniref:nuclease-related domain-containing protein n=1 Tax=Pedococcus bigeumensis TaxID=433644 RepID=UPI0030C831A0
MQELLGVDNGGRGHRGALLRVGCERSLEGSRGDRACVSRTRSPPRRTPLCWTQLQGVWGERATANALRALEREGWVVLHDLPAGRGNVDHIAIGPGGVFLLDSKRLGGSASVDDGILTVERFGDSDLTYTHPGPGH